MADEELAEPKDKRILLIDDDAAILEIMSHVLEQEGFQAECSTGGEDALARIEKQLPDLILLDLMMPRYGGYEILRNLQNGEAARVPVMVITGRNTDTSTSDMIRQESNVIDFLTKPVNFGYLREKLHKVLKTRPPVRVSRK